MTQSSEPMTLHSLRASQSNRVKVLQLRMALKMFVYYLLRVLLANSSGFPSIFITVSLTDLTQSNSDDGLPQVNLVVLGAQGVGKSTFVQNSLDLTSPSASAFAVKKMSLDDIVYLVRLIEISLDDTVLTECNRIKWPKSLKGVDIPPVDGVLVLYDVTNQESITGIPDLLRWSPCSPSFSPHFQLSFSACKVLATESAAPHTSFRHLFTLSR
jgi:hypothetical protein